MKVNQTCQMLCPPRALTSGEVAAFKEKVQLEYNVHWMVDELPAAAVGLTEDGSTIYARGFPVGEALVDTGDIFLFNHARMVIKYHESPDEYSGARVVGFEVEPMSVLHRLDANATTLLDCNAETGITAATVAPRMMITGPEAAQEVRVTWTYDVFWVESDIKWASRWDIYLSMGHRYRDDIHWFSIINSIVICLFLTGMVAIIVVRAVHRDITRYNRVPTDEERAEEREETGWKLVHGDVFRAPATRPQLFSVMMGVGAQIYFMAFFTILFAAIGFLSPANRGMLMIALFVLYMLMGAVGGYVSSRTYKFFKLQQWQRTTLWTAFGFPAFVFTILFVLNLFVWSKGSVNAVPFGSMFAVLALWLVLSVPLVFFGAHMGFRADAVTIPVAISDMPRPVPVQPWYLSLSFAMAVGGLLPFGTVFVELFFILTSIWLDQYYYVFGFLLFVFVLLVVTCAEIAIVLTYFQLCAEDYTWWWRSFLVPAASGIYLFLYSIFYFATRLEMSGFVPTLLYFGYMFVIAAIFFMCTGFIGFAASFIFNRIIYGAIKVD